MLVIHVDAVCSCRGFFYRIFGLLYVRLLMSIKNSSKSRFVAPNKPFLAHFTQAAASRFWICIQYMLMCGAARCICSHSLLELLKKTFAYCILPVCVCVCCFFLSLLCFTLASVRPALRGLCSLCTVQLHRKHANAAARCVAACRHGSMLGDAVGAAGSPVLHLGASRQGDSNRVLELFAQDRVSLQGR